MKRIGFALCGSFCCFEKAFFAMEKLVASGYQVTPIFSFASQTCNTRFGSPDRHLLRAEMICGRPPVCKLEEAERFGPEKSFDLMVVAPCTASTCRRLADGLYDTPVSLGVKAHLRNGRPVLLAICTNDALSLSAPTIGRLLPLKNFFFVPMVQDDPENKPTSAVADFSLLPAAVSAALEGKQLRPLFLLPKV